MSLVVFFFAAVAAIVTAGAVVLQRNPFVSALALLGHLSSLAALYLLLEADFVGAAQVIVYAGAVMVMFLFVIAYVGPRGELDDAKDRPGWQVGAGIGVAILILVQITLAITRTDFGEAASTTPDEGLPAFGSPAAVGRILLTDQLFAFEAVSVLLLIGAIVGVMLGAGHRPHRVRTPEEQLRRDNIRAKRAELARTGSAVETRAAASRRLLDEAREETNR